MATSADPQETPLIAKSSKSEQLSFFWGQILLNPTITGINFFCFLLFTTYMGLILIPLGLLQASILGIIYKLDNAGQAYITSAVQFIQIVLQLIITPWIGFFCDKYGRKILVSSGLVILCITIFATPHLPSPYPYYIINQCIQSICCTALIIPPLLADYIDKSTHGRMSGLSSVLLHAGSFFITSLNKNQEETEENLRKKLFYLAVIASSLASVIVLGLKGGSYHKTSIKSNDTIQEYVSLNEDNEDATPAPPSQPEAQPGLMAGIKEAKNPWILTGYILNFLMMSSVSLTSFCLIKYVTYLVNDDKQANLAIALVNKHLLSAAVFSGLFGFIADKVNKFKLILFNVFCSMTSITLLLLIKSPTEPMAYVAMVFFGSAAAGFMTVSGQLLNKYASPQFRGSVLAVGGMVALAAGASINILGVYLLHWSVFIPFLMYFGYAIIGLLVLIILYISKKDILNKP